MTNPFNFADAVGGKSNQQLYNEEMARLAASDLARAQALNQISQYQLNNQQLSARDVDYLRRMGLSDREIATTGLNYKQSAELFKALHDADRADTLQRSALAGNINAHMFNKSTAPYKQTATGTMLNTYTGRQMVSDLDKAKAFDFLNNASGGSDGSGASGYKPYSPSELKTLSSSMVGDEGINPRFGAMFADILDVESMPSEAVGYAKRRVIELASQPKPDGTRMSPAEIQRRVAAEIRHGLSIDEGWISDTASFKPPIIMTINGKNYIQSADGRVFEYP